MIPDPSNATELQVDVLPPGTSDGDCRGKSDDQLAEITKYALAMFGELADLNTHDRVEILMIRHGWKQADVARALGIRKQAVSVHWANICEELDIDETPARQRSMISRQCDAMYQRAARMGDPAKGIPIALKALEIKARLYGLNLEAQAGDSSLVPYKTPEEVAETVQRHILEQHGRGNLAEPTTKG